MLMFSPLIRHHHFAPSWRQPAMQETREYTGREGNGYDRDRESISSLCGNELRLLYTCASRVSLLDFEKYFRRCPTILVRTKSCPDAIAMRFVMIRPNFAASPIKCHDAPMLLPTCVFFIVVVWILFNGSGLQRASLSGRASSSSWRPWCINAAAVVSVHGAFVHRIAGVLHRLSASQAVSRPNRDIFSVASNRTAWWRRARAQGK